MQGNLTVWLQKLSFLICFVRNFIEIYCFVSLTAEMETNEHKILQIVADNSF